MPRPEGIQFDNFDITTIIGSLEDGYAKVISKRGEIPKVTTGKAEHDY